MKLKIDLNNPASLRQAIMGSFGEAQTCLMGILDKVPDSFKPQFKELKDKLDGMLLALKNEPTTQIPAAEMGAALLSNAAYYLSCIQDQLDRTMGALNGLVEEYSPKVAQLQSLELAQQKGDLLTKEKADEAAALKVKEAVEKEQKRYELLGKRRAALLSAELPPPLDDQALEGDEAAFGALAKSAGERLKELKEKTADAQLNAREIAELIYGPESDFKKVMKLSRCAAQSGADADPLAGGGNRNEEKKNGKKLRVM